MIDHIPSKKWFEELRGLTCSRLFIKVDFPEPWSPITAILYLIEAARFENSDKLLLVSLAHPCLPLPVIMLLSLKVMGLEADMCLLSRNSEPNRTSF
jgi:hypothetical protein